MLWLLLFLVLIYMLLLPLTLRVDMHSFDALQVMLHLDCPLLRKTWQYQLARTAQGHQLQRKDELGTTPVNPTPQQQNGARQLLSLLHRVDKARHFLLARLHLERLDALLLLRTGDAARSALLSGGIQGLAGCIPAHLRRKVHIRVMPEFFRAHSTLQARCIIRFRLGTIILTAIMLLAAYIRGQHPTESEAMQYGTSHR